MQLQQIQAMAPFLAGCSAVLCHSWEEEHWLLGFPDMMQLGVPQGTLLMAFQQRGRRPVSPAIAFGVGSAPHSHRCFWHLPTFLLIKWKRETAFLRCK